MQICQPAQLEVEQVEVGKMGGNHKGNELRESLRSRVCANAQILIKSFRFPNKCKTPMFELQLESKSRLQKTDRCLLTGFFCRRIVVVSLNTNEEHE